MFIITVIGASIYIKSDYFKNESAIVFDKSKTWSDIKSNPRKDLLNAIDEMYHHTPRILPDCAILPQYLKDYFKLKNKLDNCEECNYREFCISYMYNKTFGGKNNESS